MNKAINFVKRLVLFFIGMTIIQFGVALFLKTNIGSDPMTVFTQGLANTLDKTAFRDTAIVKMIAGTNVVTPGVANMIILVILTAIILLVERHRINVGTIICVIGVGPIIDLGVKVISYFPVENCNLIVKMILVLLGCFIIALGFAVLSASNIGVAPNDIVPFIIQDITKAQYRTVRIIMDAILLIGGFFLGGVVGIGTVISMFAIGSFIQLLLPYGEKFVNLIVGKDDIDEDNTEAVTA